MVLVGLPHACACVGCEMLAFGSSPRRHSTAEQDEKQAAESCSSRQWRAIMLSSPPPIAWQHAQVAIGETMVRDPKTNKSHARLVRAYWDTEKHPGE